MIKRNSLYTLLIFTALLTLTLYSCDPGKQYEKEEAVKIQDYLKSVPNYSYDLLPSGLYFYSLHEGTGIAPEVHDTVYVMYAGKFLEGTVFDTNLETTDTLKVPLGEGWLIPGFDEGIGLMRVGQKASLVIPSKLAYGTQGYLFILGYTPLLFEVELVRVKRTGK